MKKGFSILEALIALSLFFIMLSYFISVITLAQQQISSSIYRSNALSIAQDFMELYLSLPADQISTGEKVVNFQFQNITYPVHISIQEPTDTELSNLNLKILRVTVDKVSLESYI